MCVICFSPKGVDAPTEEKIRDMFRANPDGAGYAYEGKNGKVVYRKGFMTVEAILKELQPLDRWKNTNLALHFRIGTAGHNDEYTCHPFPITTDYNVLRKTEGKGAVLFHNGVFDKGGLVDRNSSDTQDFVVAFAPLLKKWHHSSVRDAWFNSVVGSSKVLIMYGRNKYKMYGKWETDGNLLVSNTNYQAYSYYGYGSDYGWYGGYSDYWERKERQGKLIKSTAEKFFEKLKTDEYVWAMDWEIEAMLECADEYDYNTMIKDGVKYGYDFDGACVWRETAEY